MGPIRSWLELSASLDAGDRSEIRAAVETGVNWGREEANTEVQLGRDGRAGLMGGHSGGGGGGGGVVVVFVWVDRTRTKYVIVIYAEICDHRCNAISISPAS